MGSENKPETIRQLLDQLGFPSGVEGDAGIRAALLELRARRAAEEAD